MSEKVLVAGATGGAGRLIISLLAKNPAYAPVAMIRKPEQAAMFQAESVQTVFGDLLEDVGDAPVGMDKVIFASGSAGDDVTTIDDFGAKRFIGACKAAQVKKFVMLSSMGADDPHAHDELRDSMLSKQAADNHLKASGLTSLICQPGWLNDDAPRGRINISGHLVEVGKISRHDVAAALIASLPDDVACDRLYVTGNGDTPIQQAIAFFS